MENRIQLPTDVLWMILEYVESEIIFEQNFVTYRGLVFASRATCVFAYKRLRKTMMILHTKVCLQSDSWKLDEQLTKNPYRILVEKERRVPKVSQELIETLECHPEWNIEFARYVDYLRFYCRRMSFVKKGRRTRCGIDTEYRTTVSYTEMTSLYDHQMTMHDPKEACIIKNVIYRHQGFSQHWDFGVFIAASRCCPSCAKRIIDVLLFDEDAEQGAMYFKARPRDGARIIEI